MPNAEVRRLKRMSEPIVIERWRCLQAAQVGIGEERAPPLILAGALQDHEAVDAPPSGRTQ